MLAVAAGNVLIALLQMLVAESGTMTSLLVRARLVQGELTSPVAAALAVGAVVLVTKLGDPTAKAKTIAYGAAGTLAVGAFFGAIALLLGLFSGMGFMSLLGFVLQGVPTLALTALALVYLLPQVITPRPAAPAFGGYGQQYPQQGYAQQPPVQQPPTGGQPYGQQPPAQQPPAQPQYGQQAPSQAQPGYAQQPPSYGGQPGYEQPGYDRQPTFDQPTFDQQGYDQQGYDQRGYEPQAPSQAPQGYEQQGYGQESYQAPQPGQQGQQAAQGHAPQAHGAQPHGSQAHGSQAQAAQPQQQPVQQEAYQPPRHERPALPPAPEPQPPAYAPTETLQSAYAAEPNPYAPQEPSGYTPSETLPTTGYAPAQEYQPAPYVPADSLPNAYTPSHSSPNAYEPSYQPADTAPGAPYQQQDAGQGSPYQQADAGAYQQQEPQQPYYEQPPAFEPQGGSPFTGYSGQEYAQQAPPAYGEPDPPVDPRSQQMLHAYQQAETYQQSTAGTHPQLHFDPAQPYQQPYDDPFGHPQTPPAPAYQQAPPADSTIRFDQSGYRPGDDPIDPTAIYTPNDPRR
ncbi:hypothetical protein GCM10010404_41250 [Nonomuraea africana]|uniref:Uncharacterized protein n=1 Tax=Nonomuraea africana TaxID=46171 RepID=A0ABR9KUL6_9ACTN|nr:hypothetical protein [Nonomuraea africana]MBE1565734.1 hypothetical protein [Nonomuraea africana]